MKKKLSIITVNYRSSKDIDECLASIMKYEKRYMDYEYIVVDNNSSDPGLKHIEDKYPFVTVYYAPLNGGFAYGNNYGIRHAHGDFILLLNPDTYLKDNSIEKLFTYMLDNGNIDMAGPKLAYPDGRNQSYFMPKSYMTLWNLFCERFFLHRIFSKSKIFNSYYKTYMDYGKTALVEQVHGAALMYKRRIEDKIGLMDENYFMYFEESDWCFQAVKNNCKLAYFPDSLIFHKGGLTSEGNWIRSTHSFISGFKYYMDKNFSCFYYYPSLVIFFYGSFLRMLAFLLMRNKNYKYCYYLIKNLVFAKKSNNKKFINT